MKRISSNCPCFAVRFLVLIFIATVTLFSCTKGNDDHFVYPKGDTTSKTTTLKPRYLWIDAAANFKSYANSKDNIAADLKLAYDAGFTDIVVDVRPSEGDVLFKTSAERQVTKLDVWEGSSYRFFERTATWDYLQAFIDAGHALGLKVHAAINTFTGGCKYMYGLGEQGMLFRESSRKDWCTSINTASGIVNEMDISDPSTYGTKFLNPLREDVQNYILQMLRDLAAYKIDGIFLDRCRYDDASSDFSDYTRAKFEAYIGTTVGNWPNDCLAYNTDPSSVTSATAPKYMKKWLEFRAKTIYDFVSKARAAVKAVNPSIQFGTYVGGWYSSYYESGVNWASSTYDTSLYYPNWASADYKNYGYASLLDFMLIGAYATPSNVYGSTEWTIQGFCKQAGIVINGATKYAGGPDVGNWYTGGQTPATLSLAVTNSVDACINSGNGYFCFDMSSVKANGYWDELKAGIDKYKAANK
jgi:uncharacterized lipoprotein YddW (UPF0748 family)